MANKMQDLPKIIICTEKGKLEQFSILLCRSIRKFGGDLSNMEIYSFAPRRGFEPSKRTIKELEKLNVVHQNVILNKKYRTDHFANKFLAGKYCEDNFDPKSILVFLDSDQIVFNPPILFQLNKNIDLLIRPVDKKGIGISNFDDTESTYWQNLYRVLNINPDKTEKVETSFGENIYPYFQGGMIVSRAKNKFFTSIAKNYDLVKNNNFCPTSGSFFIEQSTFSATVSQSKLYYKLIQNSYNYPFSLHNEIQKEKQLQDLSEMVTAHYHNMLTAKNKPEYFTNFLLNTEKGNWLKTQIIELEIKPDSRLIKLANKVKRKLLK